VFHFGLCADLFLVCSSQQLQTRSADEPMTTFVTCVACNNKWKCKWDSSTLCSIAVLVEAASLQQHRRRLALNEHTHVYGLAVSWTLSSANA
jgi:hypothetical protein